MPRFRAFVLPAVIAFGAMALPAGAQNVAELQVTPETVTLRVGQKQPLFATAFDGNGNLIPTARFTYASSDSTLVRVQSDGVVIGLRAGAATVRVSAGQRAVAVPVTVEGETPPPPPDTARTTPGLPPPAGLNIEPSTIYLLPSENLRLAVRGFQEDGSPAAVTGAQWKSLTPSIATVDDGLVVGIAPGRGIIQVSVPGGAVATAPVEVAVADFAVLPDQLVLAPYDLDTFTVVVPSQGDREIRAGVQWRVTVPEVARVGPTGIIQGLAPGQTEVVATGFFQEKRVPVLVHRPVQFVEFSPRASGGPIRMPLFGARRFTARAIGADSLPVPEAVMAWAVGDTAIAAYDPATSELRARAIGTTTLTLRTTAIEPVTWDIEVVPGEIGLDRARVGLLPGERTGFAAFLLDDGGGRIGPAADLTWQSDDARVAVVGNDGVAEAVGFGRARITATTRWGRSATAEVFVTGDLIYASNRGGGKFGIYQLYTRDPLRADPILADTAFNSLQPALSPDRTRVVFASDRGGDLDLWLMDAGGGNLVRLTDTPGADTDPAWMPDGSRIVFASARAGVTQLFSIRPDGTGLLQLTSSGGGNGDPAVSPDGRTIAFVSTRDGNAEVYRMAADGSSQVNVTGSAERDGSPRFFPNGDLALASEVRRRGYQVLRVPADGSAPVTLVTNPNPITAFAVSRDGALLAVVAGRVTDTRRNRAQFTFSLEPADAAGTAVTVPLVLNEQVGGVGF